jgi:Sec-independent protein translocase protein TatA
MRGLGQGVKEFKDASKGDEKQAEVKENPTDSNLEQK